MLSLKHREEAPEGRKRVVVPKRIHGNDPLLPRRSTGFKVYLVEDPKFQSTISRTKNESLLDPPSAKSYFIYVGQLKGHESLGLKDHVNL